MPQAHMEHFCDICGDVGVKEAILTCCQCKSSTEHMYCMKPPLEMPCDWVCEECKFSCKMSPASTLPKKVPSILKLSKSVELNNGASQSEKSRDLLNQKQKGVSICWEKKVTTGKTMYICAEEAILLSSGAKNPMSNLKHDHDSAPCRKSEAKKFGNAIITGRKKFKKFPGGNVGEPMELRPSSAQNVNRNFLPDLAKHTYTPALSASWQGSFSIYDLTNGEVNLQIRAHCPSRVRGKVYEFSKKMPHVLQFELVSSKEFWIYFFQEYFPDIRDIGLYFFSSDTKRSDYFVSFLDSMNEKDLALRKQIDDRELLVFTSKLLPADFQCFHAVRILSFIAFR